MRSLLPLLLLTTLSRADVGTLVPSDKQAPDATILSTGETSIDIQIDGSKARIVMRQIFTNHTAAQLEGIYTFSLPGSALLSDFAVWDGEVRIPGVILERKRAEEIYQDIRLQTLDPGLLQLGERDVDEARRTSVFSARIVPIPAYGSKRIELEYQQRLSVENLASLLSVPLKPAVYRQQTVGRLSIALTLQTAHPFKDFEVVSKAYPLKITERTANRVTASYQAGNVILIEDLALRWVRQTPSGDEIKVAAQRTDAEPGFFEVSTLLAPEAAAPAPAARTIVALFDASLSMQWEKLEKSYEALAKLLATVREQDRFNVIVFNSGQSPFAPSPVPGGTVNVERALAFVKDQPLRGGTALQAALAKGLEQNPNLLVLISDGGATEGEIRNAKLTDEFARRWSAARPRVFVYAAGDDVNANLLRVLARNDGEFTWVRGTEDATFPLNAFLGKMNRRPTPGLRLDAQPSSGLEMIYPLQDSVYAGSEAAWVGRYRTPGAVRFKVRNAEATATLPAAESAHPQLPRTWAKARVDALLERIDREGEDKASIDEIIRLSRKYKFVTPYTSFLAAPRALLRPRLIRPGDPVLRVHTDAAIKSVVAVFPFGLTKTLRYLPGEDVWQTRFLAPVDMKDGSHAVRLLLRDRNGRTYTESKSFLIISQPPVVHARLDRAAYHHGDMVTIKASASASTRILTARMYGIAPVSLRWNETEKSNIGRFTVPASLAPGRYRLTVVAEDVAHNLSSQEAPLDVLP